MRLLPHTKCHIAGGQAKPRKEMNKKIRKKRKLQMEALAQAETEKGAQSTALVPVDGKAKGSSGMTPVTPAEQLQHLMKTHEVCCELCGAKSTEEVQLSIVTGYSFCLCWGFRLSNVAEAQLRLTVTTLTTLIHYHNFSHHFQFSMGSFVFRRWPCFFFFGHDSELMSYWSITLPSSCFSHVPCVTRFTRPCNYPAIECHSLQQSGTVFLRRLPIVIAVAQLNQLKLHLLSLL